MKRVAGTTIGDTALKSLWIKRLPNVAQPIIAASAGTPQEFTKVADEIIDALRPQVNRVAAEGPNEINELKAAILQMTKQFQ